MELNRRRTLEESNAVFAELNEAFSILRKATQQVEETTNEVNAARLNLSRVEGSMTAKPRDLEKARMKYQAASEKLTIARASFRQCDDVCRSLQNKVHMVDVPRVSRMLSGLEAARGTEVRGILQATTRLDRQAAEMDAQCTAEMEQKVGGIVLDDVLDSLMGAGEPINTNGNSANNVYDDSRRFSITRPLVSRAATTHPIALEPPSSSVPRTLIDAQPSPSYYPNEALKASAELLERKNWAPNSQIIR